MKVFYSLLLSISLLISPLQTEALSIDLSELINVLYNGEELTKIYYDDDLVWEANASLVVYENKTMLDTSVFKSYVNDSLNSSKSVANFWGDYVGDSYTLNVCQFTEAAKQKYKYMAVQYTLSSSVKLRDGGSNSGAMISKLNIAEEYTMFDGEKMTVNVIAPIQDIIHTVSCGWAGSDANGTAKITSLILYAKDPSPKRFVVFSANIPPNSVSEIFPESNRQMNEEWLSNVMSPIGVNYGSTNHGSGTKTTVAFVPTQKALDTYTYARIKLKSCISTADGAGNASASFCGIVLPTNAWQGSMADTTILYIELTGITDVIVYAEYNSSLIQRVANASIAIEEISLTNEID